MKRYESLELEVVLLDGDYNIITESLPEDNVVDSDGIFTSMESAIKEAFNL